MFMGKFNHVLDPKNRVIVPAKFREELKDKFVITLGLDGCLYLMTYENFEKFAEKLTDLPYTKRGRFFQRQFSGNASEAETDKQGRIVIPLDLKKKANIDKEVVFVGSINKIELWAKEVYDNNEIDGTIEDIAEEMAVEFGLRL
ncbi:MAG: division/cell wall cluster transcriptional repressor MraZ [Lachnospiraceae bacterium]|nr:division/cell wall cluster transcriptional repressor MraZ [Lachnospiraceae bacterium]